MRAVLDQTQRRLLGAVEELLLNAGDRHRELTDALAAQQKTAGHGSDLLLRAQTREFEALTQLFQGFTPRAPMPSSGGYALNPTDLLDLVHLIRTRQPRLVLELGSGTSTVWIAYELQKSGGRLVSLDHEAAYAEKTRAALAAHGLSEVAEVRDAPLRPVVLDGRSFPWYDVDAAGRPRRRGPAGDRRAAGEDRPGRPVPGDACPGGPARRHRDDRLRRRAPAGRAGGAA